MQCFWCLFTGLVFYYKSSKLRVGEIHHRYRKSTSFYTETPYILISFALWTFEFWKNLKRNSISFTTPIWSSKFDPTSRNNRWTNQKYTPTWQLLSYLFLRPIMILRLFEILSDLLITNTHFHHENRFQFLSISGTLIWKEIYFITWRLFYQLLTKHSFLGTLPKGYDWLHHFST